MQTTRPFIVGEVYAWDQRNESAIEEFMSSLANGEQQGCRVPGYSMFLIYKGNLMNRDVNPEVVREQCERMAKWYMDTIISEKPGRWQRAKED